MTKSSSETILITGSGGWLGSLLPSTLLQLEPEKQFNFILADIALPKEVPGAESEVFKADLTVPSQLDALFTTKFGVPDTIYSLHGIMSKGSEENWDLGMRVNVDSTRALLEKARHSKTTEGKPIRFIFTSSVATLGSPNVAFPNVVKPETACFPEGAYGTGKLIGEYLVTEYTRMGFVDGISIKLPTIIIRPGVPSRATSAFVSGLIREPLQGLEAICPIGSSLDDPLLSSTKVWVSSPSTVLANFVHARNVPSSSLPSYWRTVNLPGFSVSVSDEIEALRKVAGEQAVSLIKFEKDETSRRIVSSWPSQFDNSFALSLGFHVDSDKDGMEKCVREFQSDLKKA